MKNEIKALAAPFAFSARRALAQVAILEARRGDARLGDPVKLARLDEQLLAARETASQATLDASREARDAGCHEGAMQWARAHGEQFGRAAELRDRLARVR